MKKEELICQISWIKSLEEKLKVIEDNISAANSLIEFCNNSGSALFVSYVEDLKDFVDFAEGQKKYLTKA